MFDVFLGKDESTRSLQQAPQNLVRNHRAQVGIRFEKPCDVGQILLPFAPSPLRIKDRPDLALEHIFQARHGQALTEDLALGRTFQEGRYRGSS